LHESDSFRYSTPLIKHPTKALHADTLYSGKINEKNGTVEVISKIHIFKDYGKEHKKLFDKWFLKKEFSELRIDNKIMLNILIKIYEQYSSEKQGNVNPFISYMSDIYKINNPDYVYIPLNNEKVIRIKFLRYVVNGKKLLWKTLKNEKLAHSRKNRIGMFDNLEWTQMRVYSLNGKYWVFPINALVNKIDHGKITVDENKVDSLLKEITKQDCKLKLIDT
jgi:hypothetical protein